MNRAQNVFSLIRVWAGKEYQDIVPALTDKSPIGDVRTAILENPVVYKEFTSLLGRLLKIECDARVWNNSFLELFISNGTPFGEITGEVVNSPVQPRDYDPTHPENLLANAFTDDFVAYYVRNIKEVFEVSISREDIKGALASYDEFDAYVEMKLASLVNGKRKSMFNHAMESIVYNYRAGMFVESPVHIPETATTQQTQNWAIDVMTKIDNFGFISSDYNKYGLLQGATGTFETFCDPEDVVLIAKASVINTRKIKELAVAMQLDEATIRNMIVKVPEFAYTYKDEDGNIQKVTSNIQMILADKKIFKFKSDLELADTFYNVDTLVSKHYQHFWASFAVSPLGNAVVYTDETSPAITALTILDWGQADGEKFIDIDTTGATQVVSCMLTPETSRIIARPSIEFVQSLAQTPKITSTSQLRACVNVTGFTSASGGQTPSTITFTAGTIPESYVKESVVANLVVDGYKMPILVECYVTE